MIFFISSTCNAARKRFVTIDNLSPHSVIIPKLGIFAFAHRGKELSFAACPEAPENTLLLETENLSSFFFTSQGATPQQR